MRTNMRWYPVVLGLALFSVIGCSKERETVQVSGTVQTSSGKPVTGLRLILEPVDGTKIGTTFGFDLDSEGHFAGNAFPTTYVFYLSTVAVERDDDDGHPINKAESTKLKASAKLLKALPPAYITSKGASADRRVTVTEGTPLTITVN
jgi:hypothetical protein